MSLNQQNSYDIDTHIAEIYDQNETKITDVEFLKTLITGKGIRRILEPFCGTGRMIIPLVHDGHKITGMDQAQGMLRLAQSKITKFPEENQKLVVIQHKDVTSEKWPTGFDLVILGYNCFYELATPEEQEFCVEQAAISLDPGGYLFIDNDHMEGDLHSSWQDIGVVHKSISGQCNDGTYLENYRETIWVDVPKRLARFRRRYVITLPNGEMKDFEFFQQKHPVSKVEVETWLKKYNFEIIAIYGDYAGNPYQDSSGRAIFWARKP